MSLSASVSLFLSLFICFNSDLCAVPALCINHQIMFQFFWTLKTRAFSCNYCARGWSMESKRTEHQMKEWLSMELSWGINSPKLCQFKCTARPHTERHTHRQTHKTLGFSSNVVCTYACTQRVCMHRYSSCLWLGAQQGRNVTYCYRRHLVTMQGHRQLPTQWLHADLSSVAGSCTRFRVGANVSNSPQFQLLIHFFNFIEEQ